MAELGIGIFVLAMIVAGFGLLILLNSFLLYICAAIASIDERTFGKAVFSTLASLFASLTITFVLSAIPFIGWIISFPLSIVIPIFITQAIFNTTFSKALVAELLRFLFISILGGLIFILGLVLIGFGSMQQGVTDFLQNQGFHILTSLCF